MSETTSPVELTAKSEKIIAKIVELSTKHEITMVATSNAIGAECVRFYKQWDGEKRADATSLLKARLYGAGLRNLDVSKHVKTFALASLCADVLSIPASVVQALLPLVKLNSSCEPEYAGDLISSQVADFVSEIKEESMHHTIVRDRVNAMLGKEKPKKTTVVSRALKTISKLTDTQLVKMLADPELVERIAKINKPESTKKAA